MPAVKMFEKSKRIMAVIFLSIANSYTAIIVTIWCGWVMHSFLGYANEASEIPIMIWSYGVALAPWVYLASKDQSEGSIIMTFFAELAYIVSIVLFFCRIDFRTIVVVFFAVMFVNIILQIIVTIISMKIPFKTQL
jgi:hypothetical protein